MPDKHFGFRIRKDANNYYAVLNGSVTLVSAPVNLDRDTICDIQGPKNWNEEGVRWERHPVYHGITTSYSESLVFVGDGEKIIKYVFDMFDIEAPLQLEVWHIQDYNTSFFWSPYFVGDIDLSTYDPDVENGGIKVNIKDGGAAALIKSGENTPYEFEMNEPDDVYVYMDGVNLQGTFNWLITANASQPIAVNGGTRWSLLNAHTLDDGEFPVAIAQTTYLQNMGSEGDPDFIQTAARDHFNYLLDPLQTILSVTARVKHQLTYRWQSGGGAASGAGARLQLKVEFIVAQDGGTFSTLQTIYTGATVPRNTDVTINLDLTSAPVLLYKGDRCHIIYSWVPSGGMAVGDSYLVLLTNDEGSIALETVFKLPGSTTRGIRYNELWNRMVNNITGGQYPIKSDFLYNETLRLINTHPYNHMVFPGDSARNLLGAKMALTFSDLAKDALVDYNLGIGVENGKIAVEPLTYWYDDHEICRFENIKNFRTVPDNENRGNLLNIGIEDQSYDILNGKNEVSGTFVFKLPFVRINKPIDLISPIRTDYTGIEQSRSVYSYKKTTDNKADRTAFKVSFTEYYNENTDGSYGDPAIIPLFAKIHNLYRPQNEPGNSATGMLFPETAYNLDFTPKNKFFRNAPLIAMYCWKRDGEEISFQTFDKNQELVTNLGDGVIVEKANVSLPINETIAGLDARPLFLPRLLQFETVVPDNFHLIMASNPRGYITLIDDGVEHKGYVNRGGQKNAEKKSFEFELRSHRDNIFPTT